MESLLPLVLATLVALAYYVPVPVHMLIASSCTIWHGSFSALKAMEAKEKRKSSGAENEYEDDINTDMHTMTSSDAYMGPVFGSVLLFGLYLVYKFCPKNLVNLLVKGYFVMFGTLCICDILVFTTKSRGWTASWHKRSLIAFRIPFYQKICEAFGEKPKPNDDEVNVTALEAVGYVIGAAIGVWYLVSNHWTANNIFGVAFSLQAIRTLSVGSFLNATILLSGLFLYDIFWVFGTDVMVTVAKKFDGPIKLLFPWGIQDSETGKWRHSLLGLGDIVMPGIFIALMLRFDHARLKAKQEDTNERQSLLASSSRVEDLPFTTRYCYFSWVMMGYFAGLSATIFVMYTFDAAQPALLYLVPACLGSALGNASRLGELSELWKYNEVVPEKTDETEKEEEEERFTEEEPSASEKDSKAKKDD
ncbi:hypothetical protein AAMO2058_001339300 [Amorphochlora amoebiformis]